VVHQIVARRLADVVLTVRDGEPVPPATQEIWKAERLERVARAQLSVGDTGTLLTATLEGPVDPDAVNRLWKLTRGNVLYLQNIVEQEFAGGRRVAQERYSQRCA